MPILLIICIIACIYAKWNKLGWRGAFSRGFLLATFFAGMLLIGGNFVYLAPVWFNWCCISIGVFTTLYQIYYLFYISKHKDLDSVSKVLLLLFLSLFFFYYLLGFPAQVVHEMFIGKWPGYRNVSKNTGFLIWRSLFWLYPIEWNRVLDDLYTK